MADLRRASPELAPHGTINSLGVIRPSKLPICTDWRTTDRQKQYGGRRPICKGANPEICANMSRSPQNPRSDPERPSERSNEPSTKHREVLHEDPRQERIKPAGISQHIPTIQTSLHKHRYLLHDVIVAPRMSPQLPTRKPGQPRRKFAGILVCRPSQKSGPGPG